MYYIRKPAPGAIHCIILFRNNSLAIVEYKSGVKRSYPGFNSIPEKAKRFITGRGASAWILDPAKNMEYSVIW